MSQIDLSRRYSQTRTLLDRAQKVIPLGSQTFSKSRVQFPVGGAPLFAQKAKGCRIWDVDGNEYIDMISSLAAVTLGYCDPDVNAAVSAQLNDGVLFSLSHPLETEVAELIVEMVPCAEMVRFGKNGSDATAGCVRLARAFTGRDHVAVCGYHGWQDWYIGTTPRNRGVPGATRAMTHSFAYNDLASLEAVLTSRPNEFACVVMEPMSLVEPAPGFLQGVADLARRHGALFVLDEVVTGFRLANGGAQELFGVTPDLVALGKGLANGFPVSAVAGRADVMQLMEEVFFSFTMGGEAVSLAAAKATLEKLKREPVTATMKATGTAIKDRTARQIADHGIGHLVQIVGHPCWTVLMFNDCGDIPSLTVKTLFMQECMLRGILTFGSHNMNYAHGQAEADRLAAVYDEVFPLLKQAVDEGKMEQLLRCPPLQPLFKVR